MDLFPFQIAASTEIADKYASYAQDPLMVTRTRLLPFYQNLSSITGSGKTLILADAISQIRSRLPVEPIVLWLSKGRVVVWQTYSNLSSGKYTELIGGFSVKPLSDCKPTDISDSSSGLILVATTAKFNQHDKEDGKLKIYQLALDLADNSLWNLLRERRTSSGIKRPFIVVYDEGHNLSNQQTQLLMGLEPDALIAASATMRIPTALEDTLERLRKDKKWKDNDFVTIVKSSEVVQSGLVKQHILLGGYITPMEIAVNEMIDNLKRVEASALQLGLPFKPKAIYVSDTNLVSGKGNTDNPQQPFNQRQARPILIWRHLVENLGIDPASIAIYCNLKFDPKIPPPESFNLYAGGDTDYNDFISKDYQHIIFNRTLQEGWDDPACYFAYIDKDMGSKDQVTQIVGRALRQPQAQHYSDPSLNTAHFYIRTDEKSVFDEVLHEVREKITVDAPEINLTVFRGGAGNSTKTTSEVQKRRELPDVFINAKDAQEPIKKIINSIPDYRFDQAATVGKGGRIQVLQTIGSQRDQSEEWVEVEHSNKVTARWVFSRKLQSIHNDAVNICDIEQEKFDALIEYNSLAADQMREAAIKVAAAYIDNSSIAQSSANPIEVPSLPVDLSTITRFNNALHDGYSGLNSLELEFAQALDRTKRVWFRNPSRGVFDIPLLTSGRTQTFNPDFVVWVDKAIIAIDTKGDHLIMEDAGRKLFFIDKIGPGPDLFIRLVTRGKWNSDPIRRENSVGFSVWTLRNGKPHANYAANIQEAVELCLR
jgi:type III restriction enzyme